MCQRLHSIPDLQPSQKVACAALARRSAGCAAFLGPPSLQNRQPIARPDAVLHQDDQACIGEELADVAAHLGREIGSRWRRLRLASVQGRHAREDILRVGATRWAVENGRDALGISKRQRHERRRQSRHRDRALRVEVKPRRVQSDRCGHQACIVDHATNLSAFFIAQLELGTGRRRLVADASMHAVDLVLKRCALLGVQHDANQGSDLLRRQRR